MQTQFDFIDFGSSLGGGFALAKRFGGRVGIGIDNDEKKVQKARKLGYNVVLGDVIKSHFDINVARFCILSHFLEHLDSANHVKFAITSAVNSARDFVFIQGPYFDADSKLKMLGVKLYWSDWHGHKTKVTTTLLTKIFKKLDMKYSIFLYDRLNSSYLPEFHSLASPIDSLGYDSKIHPPKPSINFSFPVYREVVAFVWVNGVKDWSTISKLRKSKDFKLFKECV